MGWESGTPGTSGDRRGETLVPTSFRPGLHDVTDSGVIGLLAPFCCTIRYWNSSQEISKTVTYPIWNGPLPHSFHSSTLQPFLSKRVGNEVRASHNLLSLKTVTSSKKNPRTTSLGDQHEPHPACVSGGFHARLGNCNNKHYFSTLP